MRLALPLAALAAIAMPASAAPEPTRLTVTLSSFQYAPDVIRLVHGRPYVLHLVNGSSRGHNFVAPAFMAAAGLDRRGVEVPGQSALDLAFTAPGPGSYKLKCTHFSHAMLGMRGRIIVE
jgi:plastocyanin